MKSIALLALAIFAGESISASACVPPPAAQVFDKDSFILFGIATGSTWQAASSEYLVTYEVLEVFRGKSPSQHTAETLCSGPIRNGERVMVGTAYGKRVVFSAYPDEQSVRDAFSPVR